MEWSNQRLFLFYKVELTWGVFYSTKNSGTFEHKWYGNYFDKFLENLKIVKFPKSEPFNQNFWKFWDEKQMEQKLDQYH